MQLKCKQILQIYQKGFPEGNLVETYSNFVDNFRSTSAWNWIGLDLKFERVKLVSHKIFLWTLTKIHATLSIIWRVKEQSWEVFPKLQVTSGIAETGIYEKWRFDKSKTSVGKKVRWNKSIEHWVGVSERASLG